MVNPEWALGLTIYARVQVPLEHSIKLDLGRYSELVRTYGAFEISQSSHLFQKIALHSQKAYGAGELKTGSWPMYARLCLELERYHRSIHMILR